MLNDLTSPQSTHFLSFKRNNRIVSCSNVYWKNVTLSQAVLSSPEPAGLINGQNFIYVCRTYFDNRWISGALEFSENIVSTCNIPSYGFHRVTNFQILISPPGTTSWITSPGSVPEIAIESGNHRSGDRGYVCRAAYQNSLTLGISTPNADGCHSTIGDREIYVGTPSKIEILILNAYGKILDEYFPHI